MRLKNAPFLGRAGWLLHRMVASYWSLPLTGVIAAVPALLVALWLDRSFATEWILANGLQPVATADTAKDLLAVAVGINAAFITLYFSLTLLVLTVASSNLGVRLVDRWLEKGLVRVSLAGLSFTLIYSLTAMATVDGEADIAATPLLVVASVIFLQAVNVAMLTVALHDLGRTIFVDRSINSLGADAASGPVSVKQGPSGDGKGTDWCRTIAAPREGYVEGNDLDHLRSLIGDHDCTLRICAAPGQHVMEGEALLRLAGHDCPDKKDSDFLKALPIGSYRSDGQGPVFRIRLLVEIAARALSPAINDFYTAITAGDRLAYAILRQRRNWIDHDTIPVFADDARLQLPGQDFRGLFEDPLSAFRQAACQYPSVSIRMIDNYARIRHVVLNDGQSDEFGSFLRQLALELRDHAASVTSFEQDREDIMNAFANGFPAESRGAS